MLYESAWCFSSSYFYVCLSFNVLIYMKEKVPFFFFKFLLNVLKPEAVWACDNNFYGAQNTETENFVIVFLFLHVSFPSMYCTVYLNLPECSENLVLFFFSFFNQEEEVFLCILGFFAAFGLIFLCFLQWGECILSLQEIVPDWNSRCWGFWSLCCFHFQRKETGMHIVVFLMNVHFIVPLTILEFHKNSSERSNIWYCGYWLDFYSLLCLIFSCGLLAM